MDERERGREKERERERVGKIESTKGRVSGVIFLLVQTITEYRNSPFTDIRVKWHDIFREFSQYRTSFPLRIISLKSCIEKHRK